jgi:catechol 2,3-dioxygenase-like lactoylglutathione lyase family enzyme
MPTVQKTACSNPPRAGHRRAAFVLLFLVPAALACGAAPGSPQNAGGGFQPLPNKEAAMPSVQVRYIVTDVDAALKFYTELLGFRVIMHPVPAFAMLSKGELRLVINTASRVGGGGQPMPDGAQQTPGGFNRFSIEVDDLEASVASLRKAGARFRNDIVIGVGGNQILLEDPSGNLIELFQPTRDEARLGPEAPRLQR